MKRLIKVISISLIMVILLSMSGCFLFRDNSFISGDFIVIFRAGEEKDINSNILVYGLSKAGKQKKTLIMPKEINGHAYKLYFKYVSFHRKWEPFGGNVEKFYLEYPRDYMEYIPGYGINYKEHNMLPNLKESYKLKKIISNQELDFVTHSIVSRYYNYDNYIKMIKQVNEDIEEKMVDIRYRLANIQFLYNYEESPNEGYFWIDDIDNGEKMEVMPDTPEREGYTFEGWYNEKECINEFDFNTVFNKPVLNEGDIYPEDYVTYVYAKWTQNP